MSKTMRKYTKEFKSETVRLALNSPSISHTAKEIGIPVATLHSWINQIKGHSKSNVISASSGSNLAQLVEENRRLNKELAILKEEKEILKKAATYFAQHQK